MLHRATLRRIPQLSVDSVGIVVIDVFSKKTPQVLFIEYDYVIEQFSADAADPSFCDPIFAKGFERPFAEARFRSGRSFQ